MFDVHVDVQDHASSKRYLAFLVYLNSGFDGGETCFPCHDLHIKAEPGKVLVFPPTLAVSTHRSSCDRETEIYYEHLLALQLMETIENTILKNLLLNEDYARKVLPFVKTDYFDNTGEKIIFKRLLSLLLTTINLQPKKFFTLNVKKEKILMMTLTKIFVITSTSSMTNNPTMIGY